MADLDLSRYLHKAPEAPALDLSKYIKKPPATGASSPEPPVAKPPAGPPPAGGAGFAGEQAQASTSGPDRQLGALGIPSEFKPFPFKDQPYVGPKPPVAGNINPPQPGAGEIPNPVQSAVEGAKEGFGSEPLPESPIERFRAGKSTGVASAEYAIELFQRLLGGAAGAVAGEVGDTAQRMGMSQGMAQRGKRDVMQAGQAAAAEGGMPEFGIGGPAAAKLKPQIDPTGVPLPYKRTPMPEEGNVQYQNRVPPEGPQAKTRVYGNQPSSMKPANQEIEPKARTDVIADEPMIKTFEDMMRPNIRPPANVNIDPSTPYNRALMQQKGIPNTSRSVPAAPVPPPRPQGVSPMAQRAAGAMPMQGKPPGMAPPANAPRPPLRPGPGAGPPRPPGGGTPSSVGARGVPPGPPLPETPGKAYIQDQADRFYQIEQQHQVDMTESRQRMKAVPKEVRDPQMDEKFYHFSEDPNVPLTPQERAAFNQYGAPLKQMEKDEYDKAVNYGAPASVLRQYDPEYMHRMAVGKSPEFDPYDQPGSRDPILTSKGGLPRTGSALQDRLFYALEDKGNPANRKVVSIDADGNVHLFDNKNRTSISPRLTRMSPISELKPGAEVEFGGRTFDIKQARTNEIEQHTNTKYHKSFFANTEANIVKLKQVNRALAEIKRMENTPEWGKYARPHIQGRYPKDGFRTPQTPLFEKWEMHPKVANVIEDFYKYDKEPASFFEKASNWMVRTLFWQPLAHAMNVGAHWQVGRGFDWLSPQGLKSLMLDMPKAIKEVVTQGPKMKELANNGSALISMSVRNRDFHQQLMHMVGKDMELYPHKWDNVFKGTGITVKDAVKWYYNGVSSILWQMGDVFMMQRVLELQRQGKSLSAAIKSAEKDIPNYRVPSEILGSRKFRQLFTNPVAFEFSRYHYGIWKAYAHMVGDLVKKGSTMEERGEAIGKMLALGVSASFVYPMVDQAIQYITGNPNAKMLRRGPYTAIDSIKQMFGEGASEPIKSLAQFLQQNMTLAPMTKTAAETLFNVDSFTGQHIAEPAQSVGQQAAALGEHAAGNAISPLQSIEQAGHAARPGESMGRALTRKAIEQAVGISNPSDQQMAGRRAVRNIQEQAAKKANQRAKAGKSGLLQEWLQNR